MLDALKQAPRRAVGAKAVLRALAAGKAQRVFLAQDADGFLCDRILIACREAGVDAVCCGTMRQLGKICGIEVKAACAAILCL